MASYKSGTHDCREFFADYSHGFFHVASADCVSKFEVYRHAKSFIYGSFSNVCERFGFVGHGVDLFFIWSSGHHWINSNWRLGIGYNNNILSYNCSTSCRFKNKIIGTRKFRKLHVYGVAIASQIHYCHDAVF